jgi:hypothetical protein
VDGGGKRLRWNAAHSTVVIPTRIHSFDTSISVEYSRRSQCYWSRVDRDRNEPVENVTLRSADARLLPRRAEMFDRRPAIGTFGAVLVIGNFTPWTISPFRSEGIGSKDHEPICNE